ncbi:hypothetical protein AA11825_2714 [Acetobacter pomorum DSM 11825]|nr:hypothetical protein [Acetobacter pomorum]GBR54623.1 hypothetical protein AA11825_2714 [Acetobacter pomorum DSM 11825]
MSKDNDEYTDVSPIKFIFWLFIFPPLFAVGAVNTLEFLMNFM